MDFKNITWDAARASSYWESYGARSIIFKRMCKTTCSGKVHHAMRQNYHQLNSPLRIDPVVFLVIFDVD